MILGDLLRFQDYETAIIVGCTAVLISVKLAACREATHSIASDTRIVAVLWQFQFENSC